MQTILNPPDEEAPAFSEYHVQLTIKREELLDVEVPIDTMGAGFAYASADRAWVMNGPTRTDDFCLLWPSEMKLAESEWEDELEQAADNKAENIPT